MQKKKVGYNPGCSFLYYWRNMWVEREIIALLPLAKGLHFDWNGRIQHKCEPHRWTTFPRHHHGPSHTSLSCTYCTVYGDPAHLVAPSADLGRKVSVFSHRNGEDSEEISDVLSECHGTEYNHRLIRQLPDSGFLLVLVCGLKTKPSRDWFCGGTGKMCSRSAAFAMVVLLLLAGSAANTGLCPPPCACFGELVDCSRLRRVQIPDTIPHWTIQLWVELRNLCLLDYCHCIGLMKFAPLQW